MHDLSLNRRGLLKVGLLGGALLAGGGVLSRSLSASADGAASGFFVLRESDLPMLRRLTPLLLEGSTAPSDMPQVVQTTLVSLDLGLHHLRKRC